jgi:hypothetical protein
MSYNTDLPPRIVRTNRTEGGSGDDWELQTNSGTTINSYTVTGISIDDWWEDLLTYVQSNARNTLEAVEDLTLLMVKKDWTLDP